MNTYHKLRVINLTSLGKVLTGILVITPLACIPSAKALEVQILPQTVKLGDTISILIKPDPEQALNTDIQNLIKPNVKVDENTYPAFAIAPNTYRSLIPTTPLEKPGVRKITILVGGQEEKKLEVIVGTRKFPVQRINLPPGKAGVKATAYELARVKEFKELQTPEKYWNGVFLNPNKGRMNTRYGVRRYYNGIFAQNYYHRGLDYAGAAGSPVIAPAAGRVALVGRVSQGFRVHGNAVGIDHGQGVTSIFLHLNRINVKEGDFVQAGDLIGTLGSTGASTGPHLHWGLYVNGKSIDPMFWKTKTID
ncbi:peptidase [Cylindrospermopsis raciborskii CENA303]|uniref:Peptidase n=1 Tax=Cylindrospermopsis raciborskii CENA303 TaxID=1170769 RepID=A0A1X4GAK7_9CYAN|nr:M23 family metallopeptidase [Cylindrospermopsis raciborskii]OSO94199.1 peptidase [Cylindrospermopsis raciborskii CENA303]